MSEEKQEVKVNCGCGSVVLKKNLSSHVKTKKHLAVVGGPPQLTRQRGVNFADAQKTDVADVDDYEEDEEDGEEDEFEEEILGILEGMDEHIVVLEKKMEDVFNRVSSAKQINELTNEVSGLKTAVNEMKAVLDSLKQN
jgi:hypothetical protein